MGRNPKAVKSGKTTMESRKRHRVVDSDSEPTSFTFSPETSSNPISTEHDRCEALNREATSTRAKNKGNKTRSKRQDRKEYDRRRKAVRRGETLDVPLKKKRNFEISATRTLQKADETECSEIEKVRIKLNVRDMAVGKRREYESMRKRVQRAGKLEVLSKRKTFDSNKMKKGHSIPDSSPVKRTTCVVDENLEEEALDSDEEMPLLEVEEGNPILTGKRNCKVRIGLIKLLDVETDGIVVPMYESEAPSSDFKQVACKLKELSSERYDALKKVFESNESIDTLNTYGCVPFDWDLSELSEYEYKSKQSFHVMPPIIETEKFYTSDLEAHLRASYLACLLEADKANCNSLAFPILGFGACPQRSAAIGIQTIFAYLHAVKCSNFQLIYIITPYMDIYERLGTFFSFVREFDLRTWTTEEYLSYEQKIYESFNIESQFSTIPGTDMVWRCFKVAVSGGLSDERLEKAKNIHHLMCQRTGVVDANYTFNRKKYRKDFSAMQFISNGVTEGENFSFSILDIRFPIRNFCGSNQILKKLWMISYYVMYFQQHSGSELDVNPLSEQYLERKELFKLLRMIHSSLVTLWNDLMSRAPFQCDCTEDYGYHEKMEVFLPRMSFPDSIMEKWVLKNRRFVLNKEACFNLIADYANYQTNFVHCENEEIKLVAVRNDQELQKMNQNSIAAWIAKKDDILSQQKEVLLNTLSDLNIHVDKVGEETDPEYYDPLDFDAKIDFHQNEERMKAIKKASKLSGDEFETAMAELDNQAAQLDQNRFKLHLREDMEMERTMRNRYFRIMSSSIISSTFPAQSTDGGESDDEVNDNGDRRWEEHGILSTIDQFIKQIIGKMALKSNLVVDRAAPKSTLKFNLYTSAPKLTDFPKPLDIGDPKEACPYCGALAFEEERSWSCCKNGAVWIPPIKKTPKEVMPIFNKEHRKALISTNAAFSMASIRYNRQSQAKGGVQSMKVKGIISFHPSALNPRDPTTAAYANFIVLENSNDEIADKRLEFVKCDKKGKLAEIFKDIQNYMDKNNRLYESYKSMKEMEEEFKKSAEHSANPSITFRIVPPGDLDKEQLKTLQSHHGVYARPSRMDKGYISVAYTFDADRNDRRGYHIFSRNPIGKPQAPLSIYSDMCDLMSYPLFYPDALGGWGLHKFKRIPKKDRIRCLFMDKVKAHLAELKENNENPEDYYELTDPEIKKAVNSIFYKRKMSKVQALPEEVDITEDENECSSSDDELDGDPTNFDNDQILAHGELEDLQDAPVDEEEVGKMPNVIMVEIGGERYPRIDKSQKTVEIPIMPAGNPFPEDSDDEPGYDRFANGADDYRNYEGLLSDDDYQEEDKDGKIEEVNFSGNVKGYGSETSAKDIEDLENNRGKLSDSVVPVDDVMELDDENVNFGDEHDAEPTAMGRNNDGIKVKNVGVRQHVSLSEYTKFSIQDRLWIPCKFQGKAGTLGQLHIIDVACRIREMRMQALATKRAVFPSITNRSALVKTYDRMLEKNFEGKKKVGMLVTMPSTVPGTSKYQRELVISAVTVANTLGLPHLFITFTGNPKWPEIKRECDKKQCVWADIPEFVNRVFKRRYELFLDDVIGKAKKSSKHGGKIQRENGIFGPVKWYNYSVEFQQRGMPHCHLLICLENPITNAAQIDEIISAEVPEYPDKSDPLYAEKMDYHQLVKDTMVHFPCQGDPTAYCNKEKKRHWKKCCKSFPHKLTDHTVLCDNEYPDYKRNSGRKFVIFRRGQAYEAGDEYVVAHNKYLLMKHRCHLNIEIVSSLQTIQYIFKYIHKGTDRVMLEATEKTEKGTFAPDSMTLDGNVFVPRNLDIAKVRQRQQEANRLMNQAGVALRPDERVALNDCSYMLDLSAMTACEAAWRISGFPMHGASHIVHRAFVHEEHKDVMFTTRGVDAAQAGRMLQQKAKGMMNAWFEANEKPQLLPNGKLSTELTLPEMFSFFIFDMKKQEFVLRKKDYSLRIMGRIQAPQPRWLELTATRLLAKCVRGPKSWKELRTYRNITHDTCLQAARARGLMDGDVEWDCALDEISRIENPTECRRFYVSILVHCAPANPKALWDGHWRQLVNRSSRWTEEQKKSHALRHIQFLLNHHGMSLDDFELSEDYNEKSLPEIDPKDDNDNPNAQRYSKTYHQTEGDKLYALLNSAQKTFVDRAVQLGKIKKVQSQRLIFVDGPGGTGKTFCYKTIYHLLASLGKKTICVSHAGIAACLLPNGCTAHRKFSIPLEVMAQMTCRVSLGSAEGDALAAVDCIVWDEISMSDWRIIHAVDILFQQLKDSTLPFGGTLIVMGGDWRQTLPIVDGVNHNGVGSYILKSHDLWNDFEKFKLIENRRAINDPDYSQWILKIGDGSNYQDIERQMVLIPENFVERTSDLALAHWVFPNVNNIDETKSAALLTLDNRTSLRLNDIVLDKLNGQLHEFLAIDSPDKALGLNVDPAIFASKTPSGMPPHRLRLKVGAQVVLLRNISIQQGLCNGTRLTVKKFGDDILHLTVNHPTENSPETVFLHRMLMSPTGKGAKSAGFKRLQYPIRLAYACTVNKSQGQTLSRCGLVLHSSVFSHGQLYVAMSRVQRGSDFKIWHTRRLHSPLDDDYFGAGILVKNVVNQNVLRERQIVDILESP